MIQTVEAVIDAAGHVQLLGEVRVDAPRRALVTVLDEPAGWHAYVLVSMEFLR